MTESSAVIFPVNAIPGKSPLVTRSARPGRILLRDPEVHINGIHRLQRDNRLTCGQILAQTYLANTQQPGERSAYGLASDRCFNVAYLSFSRLLLRAGIVVFRMSNHSGLVQFLGATVVDYRQIPLRFHIGELGFLLPSVEFDKNVSLMHPLARLEMNFIDRAWQISAYGHALDRSRGTDYCQCGGPCLALGNHGSNRRRRNLESRTLGDRDLDLFEFDESKCA